VRRLLYMCDMVLGAVFEAITQVHGTNRFRDYYAGIDRRLHNWLVKPVSLSRITSEPNLARVNIRGRSEVAFK